MYVVRRFKIGDGDYMSGAFSVFNRASFYRHTADDEIIAVFRHDLCDVRTSGKEIIAAAIMLDLKQEPLPIQINGERMATLLFLTEDNMKTLRREGIPIGTIGAPVSRTSIRDTIVSSLRRRMNGPAAAAWRRQTPAYNM
jgi:hypothetical protein